MINSWQKKIQWLSAAFIVSALMMVGADTVHANIDGANGPITGFKQGKVMARSLVRGPNGKPILATFTPTGEVENVIGEMSGELDNATIMAADVYRSLVETYRNLKSQYNLPEQQSNVIELTREAYLASRFITAVGMEIQKPALSELDVSVLVRISRKGTATDPVPYVVPAVQFVLQTFPITLPPEELATNIRALLIKSDGRIHTQATTNIGFRAAWIADTQANTAQDQNALRQAGQTPLGPVRGALVRVAVEGSASITDAEGHYSVDYIAPPCPGFSYDIQNSVVAQLAQTHFNPHGRVASFYSIYVPFNIYCFGEHKNLANTPNLSAQTAYVDSVGVLATTTDFNQPLDIHVDVMSLAGQGALSNPNSNDPIPLGETKYNYATPIFNPLDPDYFDLNRDYVKDFAFRCTDHYNIFFNAPPADQDPCVAKPDVVRAFDYPPDVTDQGLLQSISKTDLNNTDIYVFRVSNGMMITERKGLANPNLLFQTSGVSDTDPTFFYNILLRGPKDIGIARMNEPDYSQWQSKAQVNPELARREADHLRPGEQVKIIAINRATGYVGTAVRSLQSAADSSSGTLRLTVDNLVLRPPNLKIKAERTTIIEAGLTKDQQKEYLIGFEGSALKSDKVIAISTEWTDADGTALPETLPGYTARLAKIVEQNTLAAVNAGRGSSVDEVPIRPGKHLQLVALPDDVAISNDHFYLQVCGYAIEDRAGCSYLPNEGATGPLQYRPKKYVPVLVPLYDEKASRLSELATHAKDQKYKWVYRPEMQFSVFELLVKEIQRKDAENNLINILPAGKDNDPTTIPGLATGDQQVQMFYDLVGAKFDVLKPFGPGRDLIFALGETEIHATVDKNQNVIFDNLDALAALTPEDYLTLRLYQNSDPENVLWQFAFETLVLESQLVSSDPWVGDTYVVTADNPTVPLIAHLLGYGLRDPVDQESVTTRWTVEGAGFMKTPSITNKDGVFENTLTMPTRAGARGIVRAAMIASPDVVAKFAVVEVVPGVPARLEIETKGNASIAQVGKVDVTIRAFDKAGNAVTDGTSLEVSVEGDARVYPDVAFKDGVAEAVIEGGLEPGTAILRVKAGDIIKTQSFEVHDLNIAITMGDTLQPGQLSTVQVKVTTVDGTAPNPPVKVELSSNVGMLQNNMLTTSAIDGSAMTYLHPGTYSAVNSKLTARINLTYVEKAFTVTAAQDEQILSARGAMVLGGRSSDGDITATRYDGTNVVLSYQAATEVSVGGAPGEQVTLTLGTRDEPAIEPLRLFELNRPELIDLATGQQAQMSGATLVNSHPNQIGKSLSFSGTQILTFSTDDTLNRSNNVGMRLAFYPLAAAGTLLDHENGAQTLSLGSDGRVTYSVKTTAGIKTVSSDSIPLNQWHRVTARYVNNVLELQVDGVNYQTTAAGDLVYDAAGAGIKVGQNYTGYLSGLRWYDYTAPSLLAFANGQQSINITVDATGHVKVPVQSTGQLGKFTPNNKLPALAIPIQTQGITRHVSLISEDKFASLGVQYLENVYDGPPPPLAQNNAEKLLNLAISSAHAGLFDSIWEGVKSVGEFFIPVGAISELIDQLKYLAGGDARFDASKMIFSALEVLTVFPIAKPLLPIVKAGGKIGGPIIKLMERFNHYKTLKYLADYVGDAAKAVVDSRSFDKFVVLLPFFITVGEMYVENPESIEIMLKSIGSAADLEGWIGFLFLPTEDQAATIATNYMGDPAREKTRVAAVSSFFMTSANASPITQMARIAGKAFAKVLVEVAEQSGKLIADDPRLLSKVFSEAYQTVRRINGQALSAYLKEIRGYLHDPKTIIAMAAVAARGTAGNLRRFLGDQSRRIGTLETIAIIAYLESRMAHFDSIDINRELSSAIQRLVRDAFVDILFTDDIKGGTKRGGRPTAQCPSNNEAEDEDYDESDPESSLLPDLAKGSSPSFFAWLKSHGALYHLSQIAILDAQSAIGGLPIAAVEKTFKVAVSEKTTVHNYIRRVDIVLGDVSDERNAKWVELKSYGRDSSRQIFTYRNGYAGGRPHALQRKWDSLTKEGKSIPLRQFYLDRIHARSDPGFEKRMQWRFHEFQKKGTGAECAGKVIYGLDPENVKEIRNSYFKFQANTPKALANMYVRGPTFKVKNSTEWAGYDANFNAQLNEIAVAASTTDLLTSSELKAFAPKIVELVTEALNK